jgi:uncharacterized protein (UPF0332 family)
MDELNWCIKMKDGLRLIEPNKNLGVGYLKMAEEAIGTMNREKDKNLRFSMSAGYYSIYYSLYAIMQKIGIKCEIHTCSLAFMKKFLFEFYSQDFIDLIDKAFIVRKNLQYYVNKEVNKNDIKLILDKSYDFFVLSRDLFSKLSEKEIKEIRNKFQEVKNE